MPERMSALTGSVRTSHTRKLHNRQPTRDHLRGRPLGEAILTQRIAGWERNLKAHIEQNVVLCQLLNDALPRLLNGRLFTDALSFRVNLVLSGYVHGSSPGRASSRCAVVHAFSQSPAHVRASQRDQRRAVPFRSSEDAADIRSTHSHQSRGCSVLILTALSHRDAHEPHRLLDADQCEAPGASAD